MSNDNLRFIPAILLILLGIGLFWVGRDGIFEISSCDGWNSINPFCYVGRFIDISISIVSTIVAAIFVLCGIILMFLEDSEQRKWFAGFFLLALFTALSWILPDPIPFVDEILLPLITSFFGWKMISPDGDSESDKGGIF